MVSKGTVEVKVKKKLQSVALTGVSISNIQVINHQIVITGTNFENVTNFAIKESGVTTAMQIESKTANTIIANTLSNVTLAAGKVFDFILSNASAASTFTVNFSLCDSTLGTKALDCTTVPNHNEVLTYDSVSGKWMPKAFAGGGLAYQGTLDASGSAPTSAGPSGAGEYFIISVAGNGYQVGDWAVDNGTTMDRIDNSSPITTVFGRTGVITATEGDYNLDKLSDVDVTTVAPTNGQFLKYNGAQWVAGTVVTAETDPNVTAFAKAALPTCAAGEVLKGNGTSLSCVTDNTGAGAFSGTANRAVVTDGTGALAVSAITDTVLGYLSGATSNIQTQLDSKLASGTFVDWSVAGVQTLEPTRLNLTTANRAVVTNGSGVPTPSSVTATELGYVSGVTSAIQTQLNAKLSAETDPNVTAFAKAALPTCAAGEVLKANGTSLSCVTDNSGAGAFTGTMNRVVLTDGATGALSTSTVTTTELGYVSGVTSAIQTQLNAKLLLLQH